MAIGDDKSLLPLGLYVSQPNLSTGGGNASRVEQWVGSGTQCRPDSISGPDRLDLRPIDGVPYCEEDADE